jgi:hypothetical protein
MRRVFEFLGVDPAPAGVSFDVIHNPADVHRRARPTVARLRDTPVGRGARAIHDRLPAGVRAAVYRPFSRPVPPPDLDPDLRERIAGLLREDVSRLRAHTGLPFADWSI